MIRSLHLLGLALMAPALAEPAPVWLCVGSPVFQKAAAPLAGYRRSQGLDVRTAGGPAPEAIAACQPRPAYILLLGDEVRGDSPDGGASWRLPAARRPYHGWKDMHPAEFVSDMALGDLDGDGLPDASVGRIPARSAAEVTAAVEKILCWEKRPPALSDLTIPVWAGDPGFSGSSRTRTSWSRGVVRNRTSR